MSKKVIAKNKTFMYNVVMLKTNTKVILSLLSITSVTAAAATNLLQHEVTAVPCSTSPCNTTFEVNVKETLSVSITTPTNWAQGDTGEFLRNKVSLNVSSNTASDFTASMYSQDTTDLTNTLRNTETLSTLSSSSVRSSFPANRWGYSLGSGTISGSTTVYGETDAGNNSSNYYPLVSTSNAPIKILTGTASGSQDIYFGAKANTATASGTYAGTVIISVVTGTIDPTTNPTTPTNPATPSTPGGAASYSGTGTTTGGTTNGATTYTYARSAGSGASATNTTTTQVSDGDNRSAYEGYTPPQGVVEKVFTESNINSASSLAAGLATTASVAAATGMFFFILAKRKEDDEDEEEELI